jgi:glycosyltransferase involved in cell wall biosynthesis
MKVLHVVRGLDVGGLERVVLDLVESGRSLGIESHIACLHDAGAWGRARRDVSVLPGRSVLLKAFCLAKLARSFDIDVLHSHNPEPHLVAVLARCMTGLPVVNTKHGRNCPDQWKWRVRNTWLNRLSSKIVAVSKDIESVALGPERTSRKKVFLIPNGIDSAHFDFNIVQKHESRKQGRRECLTIGAVGRLRPEKNYSMLIRAFALLQTRLACTSRSSQNCQLLLVGNGPQRGQLEAEAIQLGIRDQCEFAGQQADIDRWMQRMDVFCLSSVTEGTSIALLEACASGLPAVVTDVGGNGEIVVNMRTGLVVPKDDVIAFSDALASLIANATAREKMGRLAHDHVKKHFSSAVMLERYVNVYVKSLRHSA